MVGVRESYRFDSNLQTSLHWFCPVDTCKRAFAKEGEDFKILHERKLMIISNNRLPLQKNMSIIPEINIILFWSQDRQDL